MTATWLSATIGARVELAFAATGDAAGGRRGRRRSAGVAPAGWWWRRTCWPTACFQDRLRTSGADVVTEPLGTHPGLVRLIANRFRRALGSPLQREQSQNARDTPYFGDLCVCSREKG